MRPIVRRARRQRLMRACLSLAVAASSVAALALVAPTGAHATGVLYPVDAPAAASSIEGPAYVAQNAVDANATSRWSSAFADNQWLQIDLGMVQRLSAIGLDWETARPKTFKIQVSDDGGSFRDATAALPGPGDVPTTARHYAQTASLDVSARYVRILGLARATGYGFSLWNVTAQYYSNLGRCTDKDPVVAATASSVESASTPAAAAFDGNTRTRWSSAFSDDQWLQADLGSQKAVCKVRLNWEAAYAKTFVIQGSVDGITFKDISNVTAGYNGYQTVFAGGVWRFIRLKGLTRATPYGYSLWEMSVIDEGVPPPPGPEPLAS